MKLLESSIMKMCGKRLDTIELFFCFFFFFAERSLCVHK